MPVPAAATSDDVATWLHDLDIVPTATADRDGVSVWDLVLDGRRRLDIRVTLILDPATGLIVWVHLAPPLGDGLRKAYRTLLAWNDEYPLAKFSLAEDGRPILAVEIPTRWLDADELGLALARVVGIADRVFEDTRPWVWVGGHVPAGYAARARRSEGLLARYAPRLPELFEA